ncbi:MAG: 4-alpha-glucanotransferase [Candidatus Gastranaerophilaceae bacterium]
MKKINDIYLSKNKIHFSLNNKNSISFGRSLEKAEQLDCTAQIDEAKRALGLSQMCLVVHSPSLPSDPSENTGIGVLALTKGTKRTIDFASNNGFDSVSLEPQGIIRGPYYCPYEGTAYSKKVVVNLKELTAKKWGCLLKPEEFKKIVQENPHPEENRVNYQYVIEKHVKALEKAYERFKSPGKEHVESINVINNKFVSFKEKNNNWLEKDAIFQILAEKYGNDYYPIWEGENSELDKNLFNADYKGAKTARLEELKKENADKIDFYKFCQFVVADQQKALKEYATIKGVKLIADRQVGFSNCDKWANQDIFLNDTCMGCPPDMFSADGQSWGFKFLDYNKLFNPDGSIGKGGEFLKSLYVKMFEENPGGVRIDHTLGLIDPWAYPDGKKALGGSRFIFSQILKDELKNTNIAQENIKGISDPYGAIMNGDDDRNRLKNKGLTDEQIELNNKELNRLKNNGVTEEQIKQAKELLKSKNDEIIKKYSLMFEKIIIPAAIEVEKVRSNNEKSEKEIEKSAKDLLLCEDLGAVTEPLIIVMKKLGLSGMRHSRWADPNDPNHIYREGNAKEEGNWRMIEGSDDSPYVNYVKFEDAKQQAQAEYVYKELIDALSENEPERKEFSLLNLKNKNNPWHFVQAKAARIILGDKNPKTPNKVIFTASGILGMTDRWNTPGTAGPQNWTARIHSFFDKTYQNKTLPKNEGISIVDSLILTMKASGKEFVDKNQKLIKNLEKYAKILHEHPDNN